MKRSHFVALSTAGPAVALSGQPGIAVAQTAVGHPSDAVRGKVNSAMGNPVVHFEIGCRDRGATTHFYRELFGWSITDTGVSSDIAAGSPEGIAGHIIALGHEPQNYTLFYVEVSDVAAYLTKAESLGGKTIVPPIPIPTGVLAWLADPEGNHVGVLQRKT